MKIITSFLWKYKFYLIAIFLFSLLFSLWNENRNLRREKTRTEHNIKNMRFAMDSIRDKNGKLHTEVNQLTLRRNELIYFNNELRDEIDSLDVKLKNVESVTKVKYKYRTIIKEKIVTDVDTIYQMYDKNKEWNYNFGKYKINYENKGFKLNTDLIIKTDTLPYLQNLHAQYDDSLIILGETQYKRRWLFWKRPVGVKLHLKSNSPAFTLDKIETYKFE